MNSYQNGRDRALNELAPKLGRLGNAGGSMEAFTKGKKAREAGQRREPPYRPGSVEYTEWIRGWDRADDLLLIRERLGNGAPPTKSFPAPSAMKSHRNWSSTDYDYFRGKGWSDAEIKKKWDEEAAGKKGPLDWSKNPQFRPY